MARLQILELPMVHNGDQTETPFILVIDGWTVDTLEEHAAINAYWDDFGKKIGARGILCVDRAIDIPANDTSAYLGNETDAPSMLKVNLEGDTDAQVRRTVDYIKRQYGSDTERSPEE